MNQTFTIEYTSHRCSKCGTFYAVEVNKNAFCPNCSWREQEKQHDEIDHLFKVICGLRGALKRKGAK